MPSAQCRMNYYSAFDIRHSALNPMVVTRDVTVTNERGLHARPAMQFVDVANGFNAQVIVTKDGDDPLEVDGKSVMQMITLEATQGTVLHLKADGDDADQAIGKLAELFETKFGEE
jgi:phosphocarrier protein HPr